MRRPIVALAVVASVCASSFFERGVAGSELPSTLQLEILVPGVNEEEKAGIVNALTEIMQFNSGKKGWKCVRFPPRASGIFDKEGVFIKVSATPSSKADGDIEVVATIWVSNIIVSTEKATIARGRTELFRHAILLQAQDTLAKAMDKAAPCTPKVKAKGSTRLTQDVQWSGDYEGEDVIDLQPNGSFSGSIEISYSWSPLTMPGGDTCTMTVPSMRSSIEVAGQYEESDGTLKFERMELQGLAGPATTRCTLDGQVITRTMPFPYLRGSDAARDYNIRLPLREGARLAFELPAPEPGASLTFTLDLRFDAQAEQPAVAAIGSAASDLIAAGTFSRGTQ